MNLNEERIREFAYQIWQSEGKPHGHAKRHWEMACKLVESHEMESVQQPTKAKPAKKAKAETIASPSPEKANSAKKEKSVDKNVTAKKASEKKVVEKKSIDKKPAVKKASAEKTTNKTEIKKAPTTKKTKTIENESISTN